MWRGKEQGTCWIAGPIQSSRHVYSGIASVLRRKPGRKMQCIFPFSPFTPSMCVFQLWKPEGKPFFSHLYLYLASGMPTYSAVAVHTELQRYTHVYMHIYINKYCCLLYEWMSLCKF